MPSLCGLRRFANLSIFLIFCFTVCGRQEEPVDKLALSQPDLEESSQPERYKFEHIAILSKLEVMEMTIGELLQERGLSRYRLSKESRVPWATLSDICSGKTWTEKENRRIKCIWKQDCRRAYRKHWMNIFRVRKSRYPIWTDFIPTAELF